MKDFFKTMKSSTRFYLGCVVYLLVLFGLWFVGLPPKALLVVLGTVFSAIIVAIIYLLSRP